MKLSSALHLSGPDPPSGKGSREAEGGAQGLPPSHRGRFEFQFKGLGWAHPLLCPWKDHSHFFSSQPGIWSLTCKKIISASSRKCRREGCHCPPQLWLQGRGAQVSPFSLPLCLLLLQKLQTGPEQVGPASIGR